MLIHAPSARLELAKRPAWVCRRAWAGAHSNTVSPCPSRGLPAPDQGHQTPPQPLTRVTGPHLSPWRSIASLAPSRTLQLRPSYGALRSQGVRARRPHSAHRRGNGDRRLVQAGSSTSNATVISCGHICLSPDCGLPRSRCRMQSDPRRDSSLLLCLVVKALLPSLYSQHHCVLWVRKFVRVVNLI